MAQQVVAEHGRGAHPRRGVRSAMPQLLSGLLWCGRRKLPVRTSGVRRGGAGQYQCDDDYDNGQTDQACTLLDARVLDEPVIEAISCATASS